jgi:hypothetical protein
MEIYKNYRLIKVFTQTERQAFDPETGRWATAEAGPTIESQVEEWVLETGAFVVFASAPQVSVYFDRAGDPLLRPDSRTCVVALTITYAPRADVPPETPS